jgi:hypothetical protein
MVLPEAIVWKNGEVSTASMTGGVPTAPLYPIIRWRRAGAAALAIGMALGPRLAHADSALTIETGSPDALCPELETTRGAVRRRLGELVVPGGSSGFRARYTIGHAPAGTPRDFVRLELFGPEGTLQLERDLPLEGESCSTMAEVIALVLDRYFRALLAGDSAAEREPAPAAEPPPPISSPVPALTAPAASPPDTGITPTDAAAVERGRPERLALVSLELGVRSASGPQLGVRALFELWPELYAGGAVHIGLSTRSEALDGGGEVSSRSAIGRIFAAWGKRLGPFRTYVGPALSLGLARGTGSGLDDAGVGYRATWAAGLDAGAVWVGSGGWSLGVSAALDAAFAELGGRFYVDDQEVLEPEPLQAWFGVAAGRDF